jgi:hypothetical protein
MTNMTSAPSSARASRRWTLAIVAGWVAAAMLAGVPAGGNTANAQTTRKSVPIIVHTGPQCLAGQGAPPAQH